MKKLHKKIGAIALAGMLVSGVFIGSGLSQGFVAHANSSSSSNDKKMKYEDLQNYIVVKSYGEKYKYEVEYLEKPMKAQESYSNRWEFARKIKDGHLEKYRKEKESIVIKIDQSYFKLFFYMSKNQRDRIIVKECSEEFGFDIKYWSESSVEVGAWIRSYLKGIPLEARKKLLEKPNKPWVNLFEYGSSFKEALQSGKIKLDKGNYYRFKVGIRDYVIYKKQ